MNPVIFNGANTTFAPPKDLAESQCMTIPAYVGQVSGGSMDGCQIVVCAWLPTFIEVERIANGHPIYISMVGGLAPHFLSTSFEQAITPA